jgi:hypothetical protein
LEKSLKTADARTVVLMLSVLNERKHAERATSLPQRQRRQTRLTSAPDSQYGWIGLLGSLLDSRTTFRTG